MSRKPDPTSDPLGRVIRDARGSRPLRDAARAAGVSLTRLQGIEMGTRRPQNTQQLLGIARAVGADENEVLAAAGSVRSEVATDLLSPGLHRAFRGGLLTDDAVAALRAAHLRALAEENRAPADGLPVDVAGFMVRRFGIDHKQSPAAPGFESPSLFLVPPGLPERHLRLLLAHAAGHALLARDTSPGGRRAPSCLYTSQSAAEHEADLLAAVIAVPPAQLRAHAEYLGTDYNLGEDEGFFAGVKDLAATFGVPAAVVAARMVADGHVARAGGAR